MTHCRTGCGAEINYKRVHFSSPVDWYDIPMEGDVIHDCPNLYLGTPTPDYFHELLDMHETLEENILTSIVYDYGSQISDIIDLPQELKMHSKEKLAERMIDQKGMSEAEARRQAGFLSREDFDKLPKSKKDDYKEFFGVEPPNKTPEERIANFRDDINRVMSFLQRCADICPAPFFVDMAGYSQLELFRIFLESKEQYADAMNCHIIQGAVDIPRGQMGADAFTEVTGRLQKKLEAERLANEWTSEDTLAVKNRHISLGLNEKEAESEAEMERISHEWEEEGEREYPTSQMIWALNQYRKELEHTKENKQDDALEHDREQIETGDTVDKEQSLDEMTKSSSQDFFGPLHEGYRNLILFIYNGEEEPNKEKWHRIYDYCSKRRKALKKKLYKMKYKDNLLGHATFGHLVQMFEDPETKKRSMGCVECNVCGKLFWNQEKLRKHFDEEDEHESTNVSSVKIEGRLAQYDELLLHLQEISYVRNMLDHEERKELPKEWKVFLASLAFIVNDFFRDLKHQHLKGKK